MRSNSGLEHFTYIVMIGGSVVWLMAQDIAYMIPIMGIIGPILVMKREQGKEAVEEIEKEIVEKLPKVFDLKSQEDKLKISAFASSVTSSQKQKYAE